MQAKLDLQVVKKFCCAARVIILAGFNSVSGGRLAPDVPPCGKAREPSGLE
jgi:hypothetical protein